MEFNDLELLARKYGTDKRTNDVGQNIYHGYTDIYYELFKDIRYDKLNILEIGVQNGFSHKMWADFFPNSKIYGIDTFEDVFCRTKIEDIETDRIKVLKASQDDEKSINEYFKKTHFDIIIDDGSHRSWHQQKSFKILFPRLKSGGYYIIEDLAVCYNRDFREFDDERSSTLKWLDLMKNNLAFSFYIEYEKMRAFIEDIKSIDIIGELGIIKKV